MKQRNDVDSNDITAILAEKDLSLDSLIEAARSGDVLLVQRLISHGADAKGKLATDVDQWESPLRVACLGQHLEVVKLLVENGADPNLDLGKSSTAFETSCGLKSSPGDSIFDLLLSRVKDVNIRSPHHTSTPLITTIFHGTARKVDALIRAGAIVDPDSVNDFQSSLAIAASLPRTEIFDLLLKHGADVNARFTEPSEDCLPCLDNITIMHYLVHAYRSSDAEKFATFDSMVDMVLARKPDLNLESTYGLTAVEIACYGKNTEVIDKLKRHGARLETDGMSAIHCAAQFSNVPVVKHLIEKYRVDVNRTYSQGNTALHLVIQCCGDGFGDGIKEQDRAEVVRLLLDNGADPAIRNAEGETFIDLCKQSKRSEVNALLKKRGLLR